MKKFIIVFLIFVTAALAKTYKHSISESDVELEVKQRFEKWFDTLSIINKRKPREILNVYLHDKGRENYVVDISSIKRDTAYYDGGVTVYVNDKILTIGIEVTATDSSVSYRISSAFDFVLLHESEPVYEPQNYVEIYEYKHYYDAIAVLAFAVAAIDVVQSDFTKHYLQWKKKNTKKTNGKYYEGLGYYYEGKYYSYSDWIILLVFLAALGIFFNL